MTNLTFRPTVSLRKVDESEFVNVRTFWALSCGRVERDGDDTLEATYELRVNHAFPADEFAMFRYDAGDCQRLVTEAERTARREAIAENEPHDCARHATTPIDDDDEPIAEAGGWRCADCRAASLNYADAVLDNEWTVLTPAQAEIFARLAAAWTALCGVVAPAVNAFARGWTEAR